MLLRVELEDGPYIADFVFGNLRPLPLRFVWKLMLIKTHLTSHSV